MKCASVDENTKLRARMQFLSCKMTFEETAINFLTIRLEQKANEARNNNKATANVCEFAVMTSHHIPYCWTCTDHQNRNLHKQNQKNIQNHNISLNHIQDLYQSKLNHQKKNQMRNIVITKQDKRKILPNWFQIKYTTSVARTNIIQEKLEKSAIQSQQHPATNSRGC